MAAIAARRTGPGRKRRRRLCTGILTLSANPDRAPATRVGRGVAARHHSHGADPETTLAAGRHRGQGGPPRPMRAHPRRRNPRRISGRPANAAKGSGAAGPGGCRASDGANRRPRPRGWRQTRVSAAALPPLRRGHPQRPQRGPPGRPGAPRLPSNATGPPLDAVAPSTAPQDRAKAALARDHHHPCRPRPFSVLRPGSGRTHPHIACRRRSPPHRRDGAAAARKGLDPV